MSSGKVVKLQVEQLPDLVIHKIKTSKSEVAIHYSKFTEANKEEKYTLTSPDLPRVEFERTLESLVPHALEVCELKDAIPHESIAVSSISISDTGFSVGLTRTLDSGKVMQLQMPHTITEDLTVEFHNQLERMAKEAIRFINGERAQLSLLNQEQQSA